MSTENLKNFLQEKGIINIEKLYVDVILAMKPAAEAGMLYKEELLLSKEISSIQTPQLEREEALNR